MIPQHIHAITLLINQLAVHFQGLSNAKLKFYLIIVLRLMGKKLAIGNVDVTAYKKRCRFHMIQFWSTPSSNFNSIYQKKPNISTLILGLWAQMNACSCLELLISFGPSWFHAYGMWVPRQVCLNKIVIFY